MAPKKATATTKATGKKKATSARKTAKVAKPAGGKKTSTGKQAAKATTQSDTKKAMVLDLLQRKHGATLAEIMKQTGWLPRSVRGFISGTVGKRLGFKVESSKNEGGDRVYRIVSK